MKAGELARIEGTLRRAYADALAAVQRDDISPEMPLGILPRRPQRGAGRRGSRRQWLVPAAAGAAVAVVALVAALLVPQGIRPAAPGAPVPRHMAYVVATGEVIPVNLRTGRALRPIMLGVPGSPAPGGTAGAVMTPNGRTIYVATYQGSVVPLDTATRTAERPIRIGGIPRGMLMSPDGRTGYALEPPYGVAVVNLALNKRAGFVKVKGAWNFALTPNGKTLYVVSWSGLVTPVETSTMRTLRPIRTPGYPGPAQDVRTGYWPSGVAISTVPSIAVAPDGKRAYVAGVEAGAADILTPISTATNTAGPPIRVPDGQWQAPISFSPDSRSGYLTGDNVTAVNLTAGTVSWTYKLPVTAAPGGPIAISNDGLTIYALAIDARTREGMIYRIASATGMPRAAPIQAGHITPLPAELAVGPGGRSLYVQSFPANAAATMASFDAVTGRPGWTIHTGWPGSVLFGPS